MKTAKELELSLLLKESHIIQLNLYINELENRINKAIEYIKSGIKYQKSGGYCELSAKQLLKILKGADKE